jgi:hypothetical protein
MAGSTAVAKLAKPVLCGALIKQIKINIAVAFGVTSSAATAWWYFVSRQRRINYENFHKNYDFDKEYKRMKKAGVFKGIPAE